MTSENLYTPNCIRTSEGIYIDIFKPEPEMICIEDIAHSLSHQCRFGGHLKEFYSVAQHSFICSQIVPKPYALQALLHDASEAYLLDIPSPIKSRLSNYKEIEDGLMLAIASKFNFTYPLSKEIKEADKAMLELEWDKLMLGNVQVDDSFKAWSSGYAKMRFLDRFKELTR